MHRLDTFLFSKGNNSTSKIHQDRWRIPKCDFYRPQRSWAKVMFLQASVILSTEGVSASVHAWIPHPPGAGTLWEQTPPRGKHPLGADTPGSRPPGSRHPPEQTPLPHPPGSRPPWEANSTIWSTSGRYASYWNAFFLHVFVILFTGGCLPQCMLGYHTLPGGRHPPPGADTPQSRHTQEQTSPWEQTHPGADTSQSRHTHP